MAKTKSKIPTVQLPKGKVTKKAAAKKKTVKGLKARTDLPPASLAPPDIVDTRPRRAPTYKEVIQTGEEAPRIPALQTVADKPPLAPVVDITDKRLVMGVQCCWLGYMGQAVDNEVNRPSCPHCGGGIILLDNNEETMLQGFRMYEVGSYTSINPPPRPHPGYTEFMGWVRKKGVEKCWPALEVAALEYFKETSRRVDPSR